jgi:radical SAM protein with 4Fe4S-binding SPASM domain
VSRLEQHRVVVEAAARSIPLDVSLELTHHCNFRCQHCYIPDFHLADGLSTKRVFSLLEELADCGTMYLTLTGGELFLRRDWYEIARRARALGFSLRLFSNGALIDEQIADQIATLWATVEISLYAMDAQVFDTITARGGTFARTKEGIERVHRRGVPLVLKMPLMVQNAGHEAAVVAYARSLGARWLITPNLVGKKDGTLDPLAHRLAPSALEGFYGSEWFGGPSGTSCHVADPDDPRFDGPLCAAASRFCAISANGDVLACTILPGSDSNVNRQPFREIWEQSPWLQQVRSIRRRDLATCSTCPKLSYCGRCHAQALVEDGNLLGPSSSAQQRAEMLERVGFVPVV